MPIQTHSSSSKKMPIIDTSENFSSKEKSHSDTCYTSLGISQRVPQGTRMYAGCGRNWDNVCGTRN